MKQTTTLEVSLLESFSTGFWPWCELDGLTKRGRLAHGIFGYRVAISRANVSLSCSLFRPRKIVE